MPPCILLAGPGTALIPDRRRLRISGRASSGEDDVRDRIAELALEIAEESVRLALEVEDGDVEAALRLAPVAHVELGDADDPLLRGGRKSDRLIGGSAVGERKVDHDLRDGVVHARRERSEGVLRNDEDHGGRHAVGGLEEVGMLPELVAEDRKSTRLN